MRKNIILLIISVILSLTENSYAQIGGNGVFRFLNLPNSAKTAALGNTFPVSENAEFSEAFANPALIRSDFNHSLALNYSNYISDINFGSVQYGLKLNKLNTISAGLMFINYGDFEETTAAGELTGNTFTAADYLLNIGYAKNWKNKLFYGANAKLVYGVYDIYSSFAIATDLSVNYKDTSSNLVVGLLFKNIGYQLKAFNQLRENLPFEISIALSKKLNHAPLRYHITYNHLEKFDLNYQNPNDEEIDLVTGESSYPSTNFSNKFTKHFVLGAEILLSPAFNIQAAYNVQKNKELSVTDVSGLSGLSFGFALHLKKMSFSYAHASLNTAGSNNFFSLQLQPSFFKIKNK